MSENGLNSGVSASVYVCTACRCILRVVAGFSLCGRRHAGPGHYGQAVCALQIGPRTRAAARKPRRRLAREAARGRGTRHAALTALVRASAEHGDEDVVGLLSRSRVVELAEGCVGRDR